ncbi:hypothetical protein SERLA73DRAFT_19626, partial [Serpula lacrymans var. lacrymans S7.3]
QPCMEGTREDIFKEIHHWLDNSTAEENILWIKGNPGAGKSAVASSLLSQLTGAGRLGGSFFFRRDDASSSDPTALWCTVAYDLAQFDTNIASAIIQNLQDRRADPQRPDILDHFNVLIKEPLVDAEPKFTKEQGYPVIVIDALDECGDSRQHQRRRALIDTLVKWSKLPKTLRLIFTSRDDRVPESLRQVCQVVTLSTGDQVTPASLSDVRMFFESRFDQLKMDFPSLEDTDWPGLPIIQKLTTRAAGLFIWAETAMRFIEQGVPEDQLDSILTGDAMMVQDNIDGLYSQVASHALGNLHMNATSQAVFQPLLSAIVFSKAPLSRKHLKHFILISVKESAIDFVLDRLKSVISTADDGLVRIGHLSFAEFLLESHLCPDPLRIHPKTRSNKNLDLLRACLQIMYDPNDGLKFNICGLETSFVRNQDVQDLAGRIKKDIGIHLAYACRFWGDHLVDASQCLSDCDWLPEMLRTLFGTHFLHWLEVMTLIHDVSVALMVLVIVTPHLSAITMKLEEFARDARRFIANFDEPISQSLPHIYLSALPFAPQDSLVSRTYLHRFSNLLTVTGKDKTWPLVMNVFTGHNHIVRSVAFSPDGKRLASASSDKSVWIWDANTGQRMLSPLRGHELTVHSVAFSPDGTQLASASGDKTVIIWDVATGDIMMHPFQGHTKPVQSVAFSPDGKLLASGSEDETIRVWEVATGHLVVDPLLGHTHCVNSVAFSPDGKQLVSACADKMVRIYTTDDWKMGKIFRGHTAGVNCAAFSPDGKQIASGSSDSTIRIWNIATGQIVAGPEFRGRDQIMSVAFSPDGRQLAFGCFDTTVSIWDIATAQIVVGPCRGHSGWISSVAFSPDGRQVASGSSDETIRTWDVVNRQAMEIPVQGHAEGISSVAVSPDGECLASGSTDQTIRLWDMKTGQMTGPGPIHGHTDGVTCISFSPDGKYIASGSDDTTSRVWDVMTGHMVAGPFQGHTKAVKSVTFSPDGKSLVSASGNKDIRMWDVATGEMMVGPFKGHRKAVHTVTFSPDGNQLASGSMDETIIIWDVAAVQMAMDPLKGHTEAINSVVFSPDGKRLISGSDDKTIRVWDVATGNTVAGPFRGHTKWVSSVAVSPDGKQVASGSGDQTMRIWDVATGRMTRAGPFHGHTHAITSVTFLSGGKHVASGSRDKTVRIWNCH